MRTALRSLSAALLAAVGVLPAAPAWGVPGDCAFLGGVVRSDGICQVETSTPSYTMNLEVPLDFPDEQAVVDYLVTTRDGFVNVAQTPDARNLPYEMDVTADSFSSQRTRSLVLTLFQNVGSAHPTTWYKAFTYDVERGRPVTFDSLFAPGSKPLDEIFPIVRSNLEGQTGLTILPGDGLDPGHYQNFAITDDSVIFFFGRAEVLPSYAGATSVTVPRNAIPPLQL